MITLMAVGDILLGRLVAERAHVAGELYPFEHVTALLRKGDIICGNLEGPLSHRGEPNTQKARELLFRADPQMATRLKATGFAVLSLANNHMLDYGTAAFQDTLEALDRVGIGYVGAGLNEREARCPLIREVGNLAIGFLAYTYGYPATGNRAGCAYRDLAAMEKDIRTLKPKVDVMVVSLHDGIEFVDYPTPRMRVLAHSAIAWGAHVVLGHHPIPCKGSRSAAGASSLIVWETLFSIMRTKRFEKLLMPALLFRS